MDYRIRVQGHLAPTWQHRFDGLGLTQEDAGTTLLSGSLPDQAALQGVLLQIVRLGLTLLDRRKLEEGGAEEKGGRAEHRKPSS